MEWMILPLKRYAEFSGRSRRKEYWMFSLFTIICSLVLGILDGLLGLSFGGAGGYSNNGVLGTIFSLGTLVPSIAVGVRRLHDTDRSGWWILSPLAAGIVGGVIGAVLGSALGSVFGWAVGLGVAGAAIAAVALLVFYVTDGTRGPNRFGGDPKDPVGDVAEVFR